MEEETKESNLSLFRRAMEISYGTWAANIFMKIASFLRRSHV